MRAYVINKLLYIIIYISLYIYIYIYIYIYETNKTEIHL